MERIFGVSKTATYVIFVASFIFVIGVINSLLFYRESTHYQIISPNGDYHLTTEIKEENGCIIFIDELGIENRVCGTYTVNRI
jgi:hypothetical protein